MNNDHYDYTDFIADILGCAFCGAAFYFFLVAL